MITLSLVVNAISAVLFPIHHRGERHCCVHHDGGFASFGCAPVDPTYWLSGNGMWITATFTEPVDQPSFRVWGMNDDDIASVSVNDIAYAMNSLTATIGERVLCGLSPDPNGVAFSGGNIAGTNPANFSYQDITLNMDGGTPSLLLALPGRAGALPA
jgi:hypothetical protein